MRLNYLYLSSRRFSIVSLLVFLCFISGPLWAEDSIFEQSGSENVEPKESLPLEPSIYSENEKGFLDRLIYIASIDAAYNLSHHEGADDTLSGGNISGIIAPRYLFNDKLSFSLMYNGNYYKKLDFYSDSVGPRARTEFQRHSLTPMFRINFGEQSNFFLVPSFFYTKTYNKDVEGGGWSDGLYNYRDVGGGLDFGAKRLGFGDKGSLRLGIQYYKRDYPNYDSLLDLATGNGIEEDERDYRGILGKIGYNIRQRTGLSMGLNYYLLFKKLDDKKVVDVPSGVLSSDEQRDYMHNLSLKLWYWFFEAGNGLRIGLDLNGGLYDSNQNYYDGIGTVSIDDDVAIDNFYDYTSYLIRPNMSYTFELIPLTAGAIYSYRKTNYRDRRAQNNDGTYKNDKQFESQHVIGVFFKYDLLEKMSIYTRYQFLDVHSNNDNMSVYDYDHTVHSFYVGCSFRL